MEIPETSVTCDMQCDMLTNVPQDVDTEEHSTGLNAESLGSQDC